MLRKVLTGYTVEDMPNVLTNEKTRLAALALLVLLLFSLKW